MKDGELYVSPLTFEVVKEYSKINYCAKLCTDDRETKRADTTKGLVRHVHEVGHIKKTYISHRNAALNFLDAGGMGSFFLAVTFEISVTYGLGRKNKVSYPIPFSPLGKAVVVANQVFAKLECCNCSSPIFSAAINSRDHLSFGETLCLNQRDIVPKQQEGY
ncbi:hypothetical protein DSO57_1019024 [Entomophthora muscae]|uniref:Uncharacterized protein n=1 Tax=Entomophthora muscae TaxID=34485 RepID=A0ACC2TRC2_9FUNG|nr:hypothetical protein DSO57_1019024 [Entomophthora muscae]